MGLTWGPSGADRNQVGPMVAPCTLLSGYRHLVLDGWLGKPMSFTYILPRMPFGSSVRGWCIARGKHIFYGVSLRLLRHGFNRYLALNVIQLLIWIKSWLSRMVVFITGQRANTVVIVLSTASNWKKRDGQTKGITDIKDNSHKPSYELLYYRR